MYKRVFSSSFQQPRRIRNWTMGLNKQAGGRPFIDKLVSRSTSASCLPEKNAKTKSACPACYIENEFSKFRKFRNECTERVSHIGKLPKNN